MQNKNMPVSMLRLLSFPLFAVVFATSTHSQTVESRSLRRKQVAQLQSFSAAKEKQAKALAAGAGEKISPQFQSFFEAAKKGDWQIMTNRYENFKKHHPQYDNKNPDLTLRTSFWSPVLEISLAYYDVVADEPKYIQEMVDGIISSIPAGSIYFGGTDPGRGLITAFSKSHADGDPFFTVTQNALADGTYLKYLRSMYGGKIYTPTDEDSQRSFNEYVKEAQQRYDDKKLKPGEDVKVSEGRVQVSGQVAVMSINALLAKTIFDKNPEHEFFIEESFPLDWMYPYLEPHGFVFKINRQPLTEVFESLVKRDFEYWQPHVAGMIGDWLTDETPVKTVTEFAERVYLRKDFKGFKGDLRFLQNENSQKMFSKLRSSIGGVYAWHVANAAKPDEKARVIRATDFAFRQAFALCPYSPEAVFRYVNFLSQQNRTSDALLVAATCQKLDPKNASVAALVEQLKSK